MHDEKEIIMSSNRYVYSVNLKLEVVASNEKDAEEFAENILRSSRSFGEIVIKDVKCLRLLDEKH